MMSVDANKNAFRKDFFTLQQDRSPADEKLFLHGMAILADLAQIAVSYENEFEHEFGFIKKAKLIEFNDIASDSIFRLRIYEVFHKWVYVKLGDEYRYVPRERLIIVTDGSIRKNGKAELKTLFPKLNSIGNYAPFLKSFDSVRACLKHISKQGVADLALEKPQLTDKQLEPQIANYQKKGIFK